MLNNEKLKRDFVIFLHHSLQRVHREKSPRSMCDSQFYGQIISVGLCQQWRWDDSQAFSLPLGPDPVKSANCNGYAKFYYQRYTYQPVYETDRTCGPVHLVGVMRTTEANEKQTVETHYFVTEMQPPNAALESIPLTFNTSLLAIYSLHSSTAQYMDQSLKKKGIKGGWNKINEKVDCKSYMNNLLFVYLSVSKITAYGPALQIVFIHLVP